MQFDFDFFLTNIMIGVAMAMDAFSVSLANGLNEPCMRARKACAMAGVFSVFQFAMPLIGWICVSTIAHYFTFFEKAIPWIALILLGFIGTKMLYEGLQPQDEECGGVRVGFLALLIQGVATSIDALSVGFAMPEYQLAETIVACTVIGLVTFIICLAGVLIGRQAGTKLAGKAGIFGGVILIVIGLKIFIESFI